MKHKYPSFFSNFHPVNIAPELEVETSESNTLSSIILIDSLHYERTSSTYLSFSRSFSMPCASFSMLDGARLRWTKQHISADNPEAIIIINPVFF